MTVYLLRFAEQYIRWCYNSSLNVFLGTRLLDKRKDEWFSKILFPNMIAQAQVLAKIDILIDNTKEGNKIN